jgi:MarR family
VSSRLSARPPESKVARRDACAGLAARPPQLQQRCLLARQATSIYNRELRPHGLTIGQMNILVVVFRLQEATQHEVSRALHLEKSTVSGDVGGMCDQGWMTRGAPTGGPHV